MNLNGDQGAIIYIRVSTKEQVFGRSLDVQKNDCLRLLKDKRWKSFGVFSDNGESAKATDRPELIRMLEFARKNQKRVQHLIIWKIDRLSREIGDYYEIKKVLRNYGIEIHSVTEPVINSSNATSETMEAVFAALARLDNRNKSEKTVASMRALIASGISPWQLPLGYLSQKNKKHGNKKREPEQIDPEKFSIIQKGLKEFSQGFHTITSITNLLNQWGLTSRSGKKILRQHVFKMLNSKVYAGILTDPWSKMEFIGKHEPAISVKEFERNQLILSGKRIMPRKKERIHPDFPLRSFVCCHACGKSFTASKSGGNGGQYGYYRCKQKGCVLSSKSINQVVLEKDFLTLLKEINPTQVAFRLFEAIAVDVWKTKQKESRRDADVIRLKVRKIEEEIANLISLKGRGLLTDDEFLTTKMSLNLKKSELDGMILDVQPENWDVQGAIRGVASSFADLRALWSGYDIYQKHRFQKMVFPEGILYDRNSGFLEPTVSPVFQVLNTIKRMHRDDASLLVTSRRIELRFKA